MRLNICIVLGAFFLLMCTAQAQAAPSRTLFLAERYTPDSVRVPLAGSVQPHQMLAMKSETEGFHLALYNDGGKTVDLTAVSRFSSSDIQVEILRAGWVNVPKASTNLRSRVGDYLDPLPPQTQAQGGSLKIAPGKWGGFVIMIHVPFGATSGVYSGTINVADQSGSLFMTQDFSIEVVATSLTHSFKNFVGLEGESYWLADKAMRNDSPDRMAQLGGLVQYLNDRDMTPITYPLAAPSGLGLYTCEYDVPGPVGAFSFLYQLKNRYLNDARLASVPYKTSGCNPDSEEDDYSPLSPGLTSAKQDDLIKPSAAAYYRRLAVVWNNVSQPKYIKNPYDEPSDQTAAQRKAMQVYIPSLNRSFHSLFENTRVMLTSWPRDSRPQRICKNIQGKFSCITASRDQYSNSKLWDNIGSDDVDLWLAPYSRLFGRINTDSLRKYGVDRSREYATRLAGIQRRGKQTGAYNFYTATRIMPQFAVDAPSTDVRLSYWMIASEGGSAHYFSNFILGWGGVTQYHPNTRLVRKGSAWDVPYYKHPQFGYAAMWGTYVYPPYDPQYGLVSEAQRNTQDGRPVTSLRAENMLQGTEDANLILMYKKRFPKALSLRTAPVVSRSYRVLPNNLGNVVFPSYQNAGLPLRIEAQRRNMIRALS